MRCYEGCPDSQLADVLKSRADASDKLTKHIPGARCTYFPMEGKYQVYSSAHKPLSAFHASVEDAVAEALKRLVVKEYEV